MPRKVESCQCGKIIKSKLNPAVFFGAESNGPMERKLYVMLKLWAFKCA